ncbi:MAG: DUF5522 domain-containing protein [Terracidiphilus sp.]|jgi:hypothetical protein
MDGNQPNAPLPALAPEDYYFDGPLMVFTAAYHWKRGSCCGSGCRHCPYGFREAGAPAAPCPAPCDDPPAGVAG